jgi:hypothetical protein
VPVYNERNVGFSQTYANLLLPTLPVGDGVMLINTAVGGTGFSSSEWTIPGGRLTKNALAGMQNLSAAFPQAFPRGAYKLHSMLWHQGEEDAGDNSQNYHADYCTYLEADMGALIDYFRGTSFAGAGRFPGASVGTPFVDGGLLPYWVDKESNGGGANGTAPTMEAIYALNTSRACTGTADSRIFSDFMADGTTPNGEPGARSGITHDVIHFNATMQVMMGHQYWGSYQRAVALSTVVPSDKTRACNVSAQMATQCN